MEINKVQWRMIAKGEKLPCDSFLMKYDGTIPPLISGAGVEIGQDAYYLPVEELRSLPKEESEDERMIQYFKDLAPFDKAEELYEKYGFSHKDAIAWLENKLDDKVESKFKVGDWFIKNDGSHINKDYDTCKISKVGNVYYTIESIYGYTGKISFETFDTNYHLWTIQDAKDGDVLCSGQIIVIFKHFEDPSYRQHIVAYIGLDTSGNVQITDGTWTLGIDKAKPATKEQRDTLLKAMSDAGYTFDFDKKELKKIEQNTTWSEEDELHIRELESLVKQVWAIAEHENDKDKIHKMSDLSFFLKTLKPQPKQEWSKEDEKMIGNIRRIIEQYALSKSAVDVNGELCEKEFIDADNWLKSLRPQSQWKPSDEQMEALKYSTYCPNEQMSKVLFELYQDLKNL